MNANTLQRNEHKGEPFNLTRKIYHITGLAIPYLFISGAFGYYLPFVFRDANRSVAFYILAIIVIALLVGEFLRFNFKFWEGLFLRVIGPLLKEKEIDKIHGSISFLFANAVVIGIFHPEICVVAILFLNYGDPAAAYFGGKYGKNRYINGKSFQGMIAGTIIAFLAAILFLLFSTLFPDLIENSILPLYTNDAIEYSTFIFIFLAAVIAMGLELISGDSFFLDDNILIPVSACSTITTALSWYNDINWLQNIYPWRDLLFPGNLLQ